MTHNLNTQPILCNYAGSKEYINTVSENVTTEQIHSPICLQIKNDYFKVQLDNDLYLPVSYNDFYTKAQPLDHVHQGRNKHLQNVYFPPEIYPIIQQTDVTLNTNKTEPYTHFEQDPNYAELKNTIKFPLPPMDDFMPQSAQIYSFSTHKPQKLLMFSYIKLNNKIL